MNRFFYSLFALFLFKISEAQCPQVYDGLNNLSSNPYWISCSGSNYTLNFQSNSSWGAYTIDWGDLSTPHNAASYTASTTITHVYTATIDTFVVKLMIPSQNCTLTGVVVMELPVTAGISVPALGSTTACAPGNFQLINNSTNNSPTTKYSWDFGDNTPLQNYNYLNHASVTNHTYAAGQPTCQTVVTLKAWNYCTFTSTSVATMNISIFEKDQAAITTSTTIKCWPLGATFTFSANTTPNCISQGNTFPRKRKWFLGNYWAYNSFNDSIVDWAVYPPSNPVTVAFPNSGSYQVVLYDSSYCGVTNASLTVNIFTAPTASIIPPPTPHCTGAFLTFTNASSAGAVYKWNFGDLPGFSTQPAGPVTHSYSAPGTYTVKHAAIVPFHNSCHDTDAVVINVLPSPTSNFSMTPVSACGTLTNVTFTDLSSSAASWNWNFGNSVTSTLSTPPAQNYTTTGTYTISLVVTATNGCTHLAQKTVSVFPFPTASFTQSPVCLNAATNFTDQSIAPPPLTGLTYTWNFGDASPPVFIVNPSHTYSTSGTFTVTLNVNNSQCSSTFTAPVTVNPKPNINFVFTPTAACHPFTVNLNNTSTGATSYTWNFGDLTSGSSATNTSHTFSNTTTSNAIYTITLSGTNSFGCSDSTKKPISVYPLPVVSASFSPSSGCSPLSVTFTNTGSGFVSSFWDFANSHTATTNPASTTYTNLPGGSTPNFYNVKLVSTSANGCKDSSSFHITLFPRPIASFTFVSPVCAPKTVSFTNQSVAANSYSWDFGGQGTSTSTNSSHYFQNTSGVTQTSVITLVATNSLGCSFTQTQSIVLFPKPDIQINSSVDSGCTRLRVIFPSIGGVNSYSWNFDNGNSATTPSAVVFFDNPTHLTKLYNVRLIGTDVNGCIDTAFKTIKVFPKPVAEFSLSSYEYFLPGAIVSPTNLSSGASTYTWTFGDGGSSNQTNPSYTYNNKGSYTITLFASSNRGCRDTFKLSSPVLILDDSFFEIPNAFTPNLSGSPGPVYDPNSLNNDIFYPRMKGVTKYRFTIFSRWGEVMFDTDKPSEGWDGYYKGNLCNQDVYVWKVYLELANGQKLDKTGNVTLIR